MLALINQPNYEEVMYDLNSVLFNCIEPAYIANRYWLELEEYISGGISEEVAYDYLNKFIRESKSN